MTNLIVNEKYNDAPVELTEPDDEVVKNVIIPVQASGKYHFEFVVSITGRCVIAVYDPTGNEAAQARVTFSSTDSKAYAFSYSRSCNYNGVLTNWMVKLERYTSTQDTPRPIVMFNGISIVSDVDTGINDIPNTLRIALLDELWGTVKEGGNGFKVPSGGSGGEPVEPDPTHTHIISGNITKLGLPYEAKVIALSTGLEPEVVGQTISDGDTGDYVIDVYPYSDEVLLYLAPDYGTPFVASFPMAEGQIVHPTIPNKRVYIAQNDGALGDSEPAWVDSGTISSGSVTLTAIPLYRPLANGFIKPTITPI